MKIRYQISTIFHIGCWLPGSLRFVVALPVDEVLKPGSKKTGVEDVTDSVLIMAIDADRRIRWNRSTREGVRLERLQQGHVEDRVKLGHGGRQVEFECGLANWLEDREWSKATCVELGRGTRRPDVSAEQPNFVASGEGRSWLSESVCRSNHCSPGFLKRQLEGFLDVVDLQHVVVCGWDRRGWGTREEGHPGMEAVVGIEGSAGSRCVDRVVVGELGQWKERSPVGLLKVGVDAEILL